MGIDAGKIADGFVRKVAVTAGPHRIWLAIGWCRSPEVSFDARAGERIAFRCRPSGGSWRIMYDATLGRRRYIAFQLG